MKEVFKMMLGYPLINWLELGIYGLFVLALFVGIGLLSYKLSYMCGAGREKDNNRAQKDVRQKKIFHDVA